MSMDAAERIPGPTPHGGAYGLLYRDSEGRPIELLEFNEHGEEIARTSLGQTDLSGFDRFDDHW
jgi:hypothetical protein